MASEPNNHSETARIKEEERKKFLQEHQHDAKPMKQKEKTGFMKWFCDMFLSGRTWKDIAMDILNNQLVPEIKDGFRNGLVSLIDMRIYKDHKTSTGGTPGNGSFITNYVDYSSKSAKTKAALEANQKREAETIKSGYEIPAFRTLMEAKNFLNDMHAYVNQFYRMTVLDLASMMKQTVNYTWDKWGWEKEEIMAIKAPTHINNPEHPYIIELPKAHVLTDG